MSLSERADRWRREPPRPPTDGDRVLMPTEAAQLLGVNTKTLTRWARKRRITHHRTLGGHRRYLESEILALRERLTHPLARYDQLTEETI